jgi:hypothetical protein
VLRLVATPPRTYWFRRLAVLVAALLLLAGAALVLRAAGGLLTHGPPAAPAHRSPVSGAYVVRPGDTVWSVARTLQPDGDIRPLVDRLVAERGGTGLVAGEVLQLDAS